MGLDKIVLYPHFDRGDCLRIVNHSKAVMLSEFGSGAAAQIILRDGERVRIYVEKDPRARVLWLEYTKS